MVYTQENLQEALKEKVSVVSDWFKEVYPGLTLETDVSFEKDILATRASFWMYPNYSNLPKYLFYEITEQMRLGNPEQVQTVLDHFVGKLQDRLEGLTQNWE